MSGESSSGGGIGFFGLLFIVFMTLKLTDVIDWSWWWVTAPLWGPLILAIVVLLIALLGALSIAVYRERKRRKSINSKGE